MISRRFSFVAFLFCLFSSASHADVYPNGLLVEYMNVSVSPRASGMVDKIFVAEGQWVARGDTLAELDASKERLDIQLTDLELDELHIQLDKTKQGMRPKEIEKMEVDIEKAKLAVEKAKSELDRSKRLADQKVVSDKDVADAKNAYDVAELTVKSQKIALDLAKEAPRQEDILLQEMKITQKLNSQEQKKMALDKMTVISSTDGVVLKLYYAPGEYAASGSPFVDVINTDSLYVDLNLPLSELKQVKEGAKVSVTVPSVTSTAYPGRVVLVSPTVDPASRTFKVRIEIGNPKRILKPGLFASVSF